MRADRDQRIETDLGRLKVSEANGRPAVKLSDNPQKATGEPAEVERYLKFFGTEDRTDQAVLV